MTRTYQVHTIEFATEVAADRFEVQGERTVGNVSDVINAFIFYRGEEQVAAFPFKQVVGVVLKNEV